MGMGIIQMQMASVRKLIVEKASGDQLDVEGVKDLVLEKLSQFLRLLESIPGFLTAKFDELDPPETRSQMRHRWAHFSLAVILPVVLAVLLLYWCCRCCCSLSGGRTVGKIMKPPRRKGLVIPRACFESNPSGYFRGLHGRAIL